MTDNRRRDRLRRRLDRQLDALARIVPQAHRVVPVLRRPSIAIIRIPLGILLVLGSLLAILPVFGLWMLPLGLLLLAIDVPSLRPMVTTVLIRLRRRASMIRRRLR